MMMFQLACLYYNLQFIPSAPNMDGKSGILVLCTHCVLGTTITKGVHRTNPTRIQQGSITRDHTLTPPSTQMIGP